MIRSRKPPNTLAWSDRTHAVRLSVAVLITLVIVGLVPLVWNETNPATSVRRADPVSTSSASASTRGINHVFVINLGNKGYTRVWNADSGAPYLANTLRLRGVLLTQYYAISRSSLPNYIAQISGQAPNPRTLNNCATYWPFTYSGMVPPGQAIGSGCVYPAKVVNLTDQLTTADRTWKGYMGDMQKSCRHPDLGKQDDSQEAVIGDQYITRTNPFVYFDSITSSPICKTNVVDLAALNDDLKSIATTPSLSYISPSVCDSGLDKPCVDGRHGGLQASNTWLKQWIPLITSSPAFKKDGLLVITFDKSNEMPSESAATTAPTNVPGGISGGRVGALVLSPFIKGGTTSDIIYNHYSLLASIEDIFSLPYLGYAGGFGLNRFGLDIYNKTS